jgi:hypothetical protein
MHSPDTPVQSICTTDKSEPKLDEANRNREHTAADVQQQSLAPRALREREHFGAPVFEVILRNFGVWITILPQRPQIRLFKQTAPLCSLRCLF